VLCQYGQGLPAVLRWRHEAASLREVRPTPVLPSARGKLDRARSITTDPRAREAGVVDPSCPISEAADSVPLALAPRAQATPAVVRSRCCLSSDG